MTSCCFVIATLCFVIRVFSNFRWTLIIIRVKESAVSGYTEKNEKNEERGNTFVWSLSHNFDSLDIAPSDVLSSVFHIDHVPSTNLSVFFMKQTK